MPKQGPGFAQRLTLTAAFQALFTEVDVLLSPVMPCSLPLISRDAPEGFAPGDWRWCPFTYLWNMTGQPAASVPWGVDDIGLPLGVQLVGRMGAEPDVIRASRIVEAAEGLRWRRGDQLPQRLVRQNLDPPQASGDLAGPPKLDEDYLILSTTANPTRGVTDRATVRGQRRRPPER